MKIVFDARFIKTSGTHDGISRYSLELAKALLRDTTSGNDLVFLICDSAVAELLGPKANVKVMHPPTSIKELTKTRAIIRKLGADVAFSPMQTLPTSPHYKTILTLHDMIYYRHKTPPHNLPLHIKLFWRLYHMSYMPQRMKLNKADLVATVSETSRRDIIRAKLTSRDVIILSNAPSLEPGKKSSKYGEKDLLYMGSFMQYKNVETLVEAMRDLPEYTLHLLSPITEKRKKELSVAPNIVFHNGVSDTDYASMLASGATLVSASKAEGYGLPLVEALATGAPVVASNLRIFREVAGNGAIYFNPTNAREFAAKVRSLEKPFMRKQVIIDGIEHSKRYSWDTTAKELLKHANSLVK